MELRIAKLDNFEKLDDTFFSLLIIIIEKTQIYLELLLNEKLIELLKICYYYFFFFLYFLNKNNFLTLI